jgi:hypothetical protein
MYFNTARRHDRERRGPQARFWEARRYPAWFWKIGSMGAGLVIMIAYVGVLRYVLP